jgi:ribosomal-protein-alanine N-acetyltransferase
LPVLRGLRLTLRELRAGDAASLLAHLSSEEVTRFISPPPTTIGGFERFIAWARTRRAQGRYACFAIIPEGEHAAVGLFQLHMLDADQGRAEWGFVLGSAYWGKGLFLDGAMLMLSFAFEIVGVQRMEARACVDNARGNGALQKVGAIREHRLWQGFHKGGRHFDQWLWSLTPRRWRARLLVHGGTIQ